MKHTDYKNILKGVSTLDVMRKNFKSILLLMILTTFSANVFGGHSTLDLVDPTFNPNVQSSAYGGKIVHAVQVLPDGKILVFGYFNSFNRVSTGRMVRLNADGSLDPTFNNQTITASQDTSSQTRILIQPDGKIVLKDGAIVADGQAPKPLVRLNSDGTLDTSFIYSLGNSVSKIAMDSLGRFLLAGNFSTPQGSRQIVRLNQDGSLDNSFNFTLNNISLLESIEAQGTRLIVGASNFRIFRLNENGSEDTSFTTVTTTGFAAGHMVVQSDNKILFNFGGIKRLNENGTPDNNFQPILLPGGAQEFKIAGDGKIVAWSGSSVATFYRFLPNGTADSSFTSFTHPTFSYCFSIQADGGIVIGDQRDVNNSTVGINNFVRLTPAGAPDPAFNSGGIGFQSILPGSVRAIQQQADGKLLLGGKFDAINNVQRIKLARLNTDSTVDQSFQINTSGTGNYFSRMFDIYQIRTQSDGKIIVSGLFDYLLNGVTKQNFVRLNSDGSIDPTFNLTYEIPDYSQIVGAGRTRFEILSDGKLIVGISKINGFGLAGPIKLNQGGSRDTSFTSALNPQSANMFIDDVVLQPDGKILVAGSHNTNNPYVSFVARLNADGSMDSTFNYSEEPNRLRSVLALLPSGKILVGTHADGALFGTVKKLNANGSPDNTFNSLSIPGGIVNALLPLPDGKIFVGGKFTLTINGQTGKNLLRLDADGNFEPTVYNLNDEVLSLAADSEGRVLVGGGFTVIGANGAGATRSFVARLTDSQVLFDFDGDGKSDLGLFNGADGLWTILSSRTNQTAWAQFGLSGDKQVTADYDGDGRADIAVFRPSEGIWYLLRSRDGFGAAQFGLSGDKPVAGDFDGDGKDDIAVFRPSEGIWYVLQSSNLQSFAVRFGAAGDIPLAQTDFDGDGRADIAVWRPADGNFYWLPTSAPGQYRVVHFGAAGDIPAPADYNGDGRVDLVVFRPSEGNWYQYLTAPNGEYSFSVIRFGLNGDVPIPADYDGDGKTDIAVRRQNEWHLLRSAQGYSFSVFGVESHTAVAAMPIP